MTLYDEESKSWTETGVWVMETNLLTYSPAVNKVNVVGKSSLPAATATEAYMGNNSQIRQLLKV